MQLARILNNFICIAIKAVMNDCKVRSISQLIVAGKGFKYLYFIALTSLKRCHLFRVHLVIRKAASSISQTIHLCIICTLRLFESKAENRKRGIFPKT